MTVSVKKQFDNVSDGIQNMIAAATHDYNKFCSNKNMQKDFAEGWVLKEGQNRFLNILWGPAIGYGSYEDFLYDSGKEYSLRIQEPFGSIDLPLKLVVVP